MKNVGLTALVTTFIVGGLTAVANTHFAAETVGIPVGEIASVIAGTVVGTVAGWVAKGRKVAKSAA
jgi:hypothetical protein